jgi:hypothetical protein
LTNPVAVPLRKELVAEAGRHGNLVPTLGAAAAQNGSAGLRLHAAQEAMDLAAMTTVGLKRALGHLIFSCLKSLQVLAVRFSSSTEIALAAHLRMASKNFPLRAISKASGSHFHMPGSKS